MKTEKVELNFSDRTVLRNPHVNTSFLDNRSIAHSHHELIAHIHQCTPTMLQQNIGILQGKFYEKLGIAFLRHEEAADPFVYENTNEKHCGLYVYKKRILNLTAYKTTETEDKVNECRKNGTSIPDWCTGSIISADTISKSDLTEKDKEIVIEQINLLNEYCNEEGKTSVLEGTLTNVKLGFLFNSVPKFYQKYHDKMKRTTAFNRARRIFINRLKLMVIYICETGEKSLAGGKKVKDLFLIESTGSDPHKDGEHALFLLPKSGGPKKVYKPHSLEFENSFMGKGGMLSFLNSLVEEEDKDKPADKKNPRFATMNIDPDSNTEEFIERKGGRKNPLSNKEEFTKYMFQFGMLEIATSLYGITDLHCENIIFGKEGPLAIDAECGGAEHTGIEGQYAPTKVKESYLINPSALYIEGEGQCVDRDLDARYQAGKAYMKELVSKNAEAIQEKYKELLKRNKSFRILPINTDTLSQKLRDYIADGDSAFGAESKEYNDVKSFLDKHKVLEGSTLLKREFEREFKSSITNGLLPAFECNLEFGEILLNGAYIGFFNKDIVEANMLKATKRKSGIAIDGE